MNLTKVSFSMTAGAVTNVLDYGAKGDGATDDTVAIQAAIYATVDGGTVLFPATSSWYVFSTVTISNAIILQGQGWRITQNAVFGTAAWLTDGSGTVLRSTATSGNAITFSNPTLVKHFKMRDMALIGPGTGTSVGVSVANTTIATVQNQMLNVLVANFATGVRFINSYESEFRSLLIRGCQRGFQALNVSGGGIFSDNHFYRCAFETCGDGVHLQLASGNSFHGCLFQNNTSNGLLIQPQVAGGVETITVEGDCWFENSGSVSINVDTTNGSTKHLAFRDSRIGDGSISLGATNVVNYLLFDNISAGGQSITIPANYTNVEVNYSEFSSITDSSKVARIVDQSAPRCIGWAKANGTAGTLTGGYNVTFSKTGVGDYRFTWVNQPIDSIYAAVASIQLFGAGTYVSEVYNQSTTYFDVRVYTTAGVLTDVSNLSVVCFK